MSKAFLLLNCDFGKEEEIIRALSAKEGVSFVYKTQGVYDLIMKLELGSMEELKRAIQEVRKNVNVRSSLTMVVAED